MATSVIRVDDDIKREIDSKRGDLTSAEYLRVVIRKEALPDTWGRIEELSGKIDRLLERLHIQ